MPGTRSLVVTFTTGRIYQYAGVQRTVYDELLKSPSKGRFFNSNIRDHYRYHELARSAG